MNARDERQRELEGKLLMLTEQAWTFFKEAYPDGAHLSLFASDDGNYVMGMKADAAGGQERAVDAFMSPDGYFRYSTAERAVRGK